MKAGDFYKIFLQHPQICTDSRKVIPGCLFFALKGDHFDGNRFAADALDRGCSYAVSDDPSAGGDPRIIQVPDVLTFLQELATFHRDQLKIPVIGLTGTNGKTTTKELLHSVLRQKYRAVATQGNLNNHIGVPMTILSAGPSTEILIVEMGANHPGEIGFLCGIAKPDSGLITNIGKAHLEGFGSPEGVIRAKNELYEWIRHHQGKLFRNGDDLLLQKLADGYSSITYGTGSQNDILGLPEESGKLLTVNWSKHGSVDLHRIQTQLTGGYNLHNILAAVAAGVFFGLSVEQIQAGIESFKPDNMRSQWLHTPNNEILLDAYNANPSSMDLAISHFAALRLPHPVAILGDMFELGDQAMEEHLIILEKVLGAGFERVLLAGGNFCQVAKDFSHPCFRDVDGLKAYLQKNPLTGCNILIKGSRGMQLEHLVSYL